MVHMIENTPNLSIIMSIICFQTIYINNTIYNAIALFLIGQLFYCGIITKEPIFIIYTLAIAPTIFDNLNMYD